MPSTTIQVKKEVKKKLVAMKLDPRETYDQVLERVLEDFRELNETTQQEIEKALRDIHSGEYRTHSQAKIEMGFFRTSS